MADNVFDQFDNSGASAGNVFDQFDPKGASFGDSVKDALWQLPQGINQGVDDVVNLFNLPRWGTKAANLFGANVPDYPRFNLLERFNPGGEYAKKAAEAVGTESQERPPSTMAGRVARASGEVLGSSAIPEATLLGNAGRLSALTPTTTMRAIGQRLGETAASQPGRMVAADAAASLGSGTGQEVAKEEGAGPVGQMLAGTAGALAPAAAISTVGGAARTLGAARASANPYERIVKGLGDQNLDELSDAVAVGNTPQDLAINRQTLGILGEEMVRTNGNTQAAIRATVSRLQALDVSQTAAQDRVRRLMGVHSDSDLLFGEYPAAAGSDVATRKRQNLANVTDEEASAMTNPGTQRLLDYIANSGSLASSQNVRNAIQQRAQGLTQSTENIIGDMSPKGQTIQDVSSMLGNATKSASAEYARVHDPANNLVDTGKLIQGLSGVINKYADIARTRGGEARDALENALREFFITTQNGQQVVLPNLQMAQDMRGALRGMITRNQIAGNNHIVNALQPMYEDVTKVMQNASTAWGNVNARWADLNLDEVAQNLGDAFASRAGPKFREQMDQFNQLAPEAQDIVRVHFTQKLLDMIANSAKLGGQTNLGNLFSLQHTRDMIRQVLGDDAAVTMARTIRDANIMARSRDMMKGSTTQPRQQMQAEQDQDLNLISAAQNADWRDWKKAAFDKVVSILRERRNKVMGRALTTPMTNTPQVAENLARMRAAHAAAQQYANAPPQPLGQVGILGNALQEEGSQ